MNIKEEKSQTPQNPTKNDELETLSVEQLAAISGGKIVVEKRGK